MITWADVAAIFVMPLLIGLAAARCARRAGQLAVAVGTWAAFASCYWLRLTLEEWSIVEQGGRSFGSFAACLKSAWAQLVWPTSSLRWLPVVATAVMVIGSLCWYIANRSLDGSQRNLRAPAKAGIVVQLALLFVFLVTWLGWMTRLLWTSVYFTEQYSSWQHAAFVLAPATGLTAVWWSGARRQAAGDESLLGILSLAILSVSICVLLATSGSIQYAMFTGGTTTFPLILWWHHRNHGASVQPLAGLLSVALGAPVILGYYFAEVHWFEVLLACLSLLMLMSWWPRPQTPAARRWALALLPALPVLVAAVIGAVGMLQEIQSVPEVESNPYSNL